MTDRSRDSASPIIGVGVVVWKGSDVLLIRRGRPPRKGQWSLPGGRQHLGETTRETAAREVAEETGVRIRLGRLLDVIDSISDGPDGPLHYTLIDFDAEWVEGNLVAGDDADAAVWADAGALAEYDLWDETVRVIRQSAAARGIRLQS